jgi:queuosine precursor transporter
VGEGLDSLVFIVVAFAGTIPTAGLLSTILAQWTVKTCYEVVVTPVTYKIVNYLKRHEEIDVYDRETRFNPFLLTD